MDHIIGLSMEMNLNYINISLSIAFSLKVLCLNNWGFHFFEFGTLEQIYFGSVRSRQRSQASYLIPPRALVILKTRPPPSIINQFSMVRTLYSIIDYLYPLHSAVNHVILSKSSRNPLPTLLRRLIMTCRLGQFFCPVFCCLIDANCPVTGDQVLSCSMHHQKNYLSFLLSF